MGRGKKDAEGRTERSPFRGHQHSDRGDAGQLPEQLGVSSRRQAGARQGWFVDGGGHECVHVPGQRELDGRLDSCSSDPARACF